MADQILSWPASLKPQGFISPGIWFSIMYIELMWLFLPLTSKEIKLKVHRVIAKRLGIYLKHALIFWLVKKRGLR